MIILASKSPRRKELLEQLNIEFKIVESNFPETSHYDNPVDMAVNYAYGKAKAVLECNPDDIIIGADTIVVLGNKIFGKPNDVNDARATLRALSGKKHQVITGVSILSREKTDNFSVTTEVLFQPIEENILEEYLKTDEWADKAGSYAIQGFSKRFIAAFFGDYENVIGLPLKELRLHLEQFYTKTDKK